MLILSSPSGAGKTTLANRLIAEDEETILSISATTRPPRPGEEEGRHYFFMDRPAFETKRAAGEFLESAEVFGNLYGTPKEAVLKALAEGLDVVFDIDWQGARQLAQSAENDVVRVFILPPSRAALAERLRNRAADAPEVVARRMAGAAEEISHWHEYDYVIVNEDLTVSLQVLHCILLAERYKRARCIGLPAIVHGLLEGEGH